MQISCSTASTELIDRTRFRRYFQLLQTMVDIAHIYEGLINHYEWKYVSLVVQNENLYTVVSSLNSIPPPVCNNVNHRLKLLVPSSSPSPGPNPQP